MLGLPLRHGTYNVGPCEARREPGMAHLARCREGKGREPRSRCGTNNEEEDAGTEEEEVGAGLRARAWGRREEGVDGATAGGWSGGRRGRRRRDDRRRGGRVRGEEARRRPTQREEGRAKAARLGPVRRVEIRRGQRRRGRRGGPAKGHARGALDMGRKGEGGRKGGRGT